MSEFARLAGQQCPPQESLALELAAELGVDGVALSAARRSLGVLARGLGDVRSPGEQLEALRALAARVLRPRRDGALLLPEVLREGRGHPVGVAVALVAVAQRAGWPVDLVGHNLRLYVAHRGHGPGAVVDPSRVEALLDPRELGEDLSWRCAHEATGVVLRQVTTAAERSGDLTRSLTASALLLALPVDGTSRAAQTAMHQRLLSRLN
ncbi:MAG TPA: transglutaminase family protein [Baekduia sp.]|uniref:transglutaminase family protein n=1 Tax=Baekduia sp. TaxID=2600305 RepID=UPI002D769804|nr:transglutaminase family protein [Baekduia sp.]HET6507249.1 transglutaminase family protein [Baekduia sp.]